MYLATLFFLNLAFFVPQSWANDCSCRDDNQCMGVSFTLRNRKAAHNLYGKITTTQRFEYNLFNNATFYLLLVDHDSNKVKVTPLEDSHNNFKEGTPQTIHFSPCDEGATILQSSTVELCVCFRRSHTHRCHKKRLIWNKVSEHLEVTTKVDSNNHERIEAHFYTEQEMLIRTIQKKDDKHRHVHVNEYDNLIVNEKATKDYAQGYLKSYNHTVGGLQDDYHKYLFKIEKK